MSGAVHWEMLEWGKLETLVLGKWEMTVAAHSETLELGNSETMEVLPKVRWELTEAPLKGSMAQMEGLVPAVKEHLA